MSALDRARDRYRDDPVFHQYVDLIRRGIREMHLTPGEIRDAAMLAAVLEEMWRPTPEGWPLK